MRVRSASEFDEPEALRPRLSGPEIRVVKFGGTSLAGTARFDAAVSRIAQLRSSGARPVVVVSALGGVTDRLLELARRTGADGSPRELDALLATGEAAAASLFAGGLESRGVVARSIDANRMGLLSDGRHGSASIESIDPEAILRLIAEGCVPVATGFQALERGGATTTLGRGGSDTTAVALAAGIAQVLEREVACEILTDVSGVHSIDPKIAESDPHARARGDMPTIPKMHHVDLVALSDGGSRIVAPAAARLAARHAVPILVARSGTGLETDRPTLVNRQASMPTQRFAIATNTDQILLTRISRDRSEAVPAARAALSRRLERLHGPTPWQLSEDGDAIMIAATKVAGAMASLESISRGTGDRAWDAGPRGDSVTVVAGSAAILEHLPPPDLRRGSRVAVWWVEPSRGEATARQWHEQLLEAIAAERTAGSPSARSGPGPSTRTRDAVIKTIGNIEIIGNIERSSAGRSRGLPIPTPGGSSAT